MFRVFAFTILYLTYIAPAQAADSYLIASGETVTINEHGVCRKVSNTLGAGIMVPTKSANEWHTGGESFLENLYSGVTATSCTSSGVWTLFTTGCNGIAGGPFPDCSGDGNYGNDGNVTGQACPSIGDQCMSVVGPPNSLWCPDLGSSPLAAFNCE